MNKKNISIKGEKEIKSRLKQLAELILDNGFSNIEFRNVSNGISAIHSGWKI